MLFHEHSLTFQSQCKQYVFTSAVSVTIKKRNRFFLNQKKSIPRFLDAINGFEISVFSHTSNQPSLCIIFELFKLSISLLPARCHLTFSCATATASNVNSLSGINDESRKKH